MGMTWSNASRSSSGKGSREYQPPFTAGWGVTVTRELGGAGRLPGLQTKLCLLLGALVPLLRSTGRLVWGSFEAVEMSEKSKHQWTNLHTVLFLEQQASSEAT